MNERLAFVSWSHEVLEGPEDVGSEQRWRVRAEDGRRLVVAQLAPDLARDESIRRRWVRDAQRVQGLGVHAIVPMVEIGPTPDPRALGAIPPFRVRLDPEGEPLSTWMLRAPVTVEEFTGVFAAIADALQAVHATGAVLRDLRPEQVIRTRDHRVLLVDVGLSRVDVLSSHTASSLLLQGSSYAAPEQVTKTAVDLRADLFSLGVMMFQALTGSLPYGDGPAFLRRESNLPDLRTVRAEIPANIDLLVRACLAIEPAQRPSTAMDVALVLRGGNAKSLAEQAVTTCQHCAATLRVGQRLCLQCGRVSVKFVSAAHNEPQYGLDLMRLDEDATQLKWLQDMLRDVSLGPIRPPEFLVGSVHLYAHEEIIQRIRLPARLYNGLSRETATQLLAMMHANRIAGAVVGTPDLPRLAMLTAVVPGTLGLLGLAVTVLSSGLVGGLICGTAFVSLLILAMRYVNHKTWVTKTMPRFRLRPLPAALPASDPLVARVAALLSPGMDEDVRAVVAELALLVQRLVDHRAQFVRDAREIDMVTAPLQPLIRSVEARVAELAHLGQQLAELDEGALVRALAVAGARKEGPQTREPILDGLDLLRALEDRRSAVFQRLLAAQSLLTRTIELGLAQHDDGAEHDRQVALAVAALGE